MSESLHLTCQCGAVLDVVAENRYSLTITHERRAFDAAHSVCRDRPQRPVGGGIPASARRRRGRRWTPPPPPPRPAPLPDPVVPST